MSALANVQIAREVAIDLPDGGCVNLGIGMPLLVATMIDTARDIIVHSENGILGMRPLADGDAADADLVDAGKNPVALRKGGSFVSHADSFSLIRGGHIDVSVMGALQVSAHGDLANWWTGEGTPGVGGAMDLAVGARRVVVIMKHVDARGVSKLVSQCSLPLTASRVVGSVYTELGIFEPDGEGVFRVVGLTRGVDLEEVRRRTDAPLIAPAVPVELPRAR